MASSGPTSTGPCLSCAQGSRDEHRTPGGSHQSGGAESPPLPCAHAAGDAARIKFPNISESGLAVSSAGSLGTLGCTSADPWLAYVQVPQVVLDVQAWGTHACGGSR